MYKFVWHEKFHSTYLGLVGLCTLLLRGSLIELLFILFLFQVEFKFLGINVSFQVPFD
jgi:hypothetical protein